MLRMLSHSETETINLGVKLVHFLGRGDIVCLFGVLGAGKTILVKGMAKGLGMNKDEVISPSFVLIREYLPAPLDSKHLTGPAGRQACSVGKTKIKPPLYHLDLYRLKDVQDILNLGYEEYLYAQGICVIEWAQRMAGYLPTEFLKIELEIRGKKKRLIKLIAKGERYHKLLKKFPTFLSRLNH